MIHSSTNEKLDRDNYINGVSDMTSYDGEMAETGTDETAWDIFVGGFDSRSLKLESQLGCRTQIAGTENVHEETRCNMSRADHIVPVSYLMC